MTHEQSDPHSRALRRGRVSSPGRVYHARATTLARAPLFADFGAARALICCLGRELGNVDTFAFCVMPDHVHWLFELGSQHSLSKILQRVKSVSAHNINKSLGRSGHVWEDGFFDRALRRDESIPDTLTYILANPIRAGLVTRLNDYPHWDAKWLPEWGGDTIL